jgi:hypothetical protein
MRQHQSIKLTRRTGSVAQVLFALVPLFSGITLIRSDPGFDHLGTTFTGGGCLATGISAMTISSAVNMRYVETIATLSDPLLSKFLGAIARSLPKALTSSLYVSFDAIKCIVKADDASPVLAQCVRAKSVPAWRDATSH